MDKDSLIREIGRPLFDKGHLVDETAKKIAEFSKRFLEKGSRLFVQRFDDQDFVIHETAVAIHETVVKIGVQLTVIFCPKDTIYTPVVSTSREGALQSLKGLVF